MPAGDAGAPYDRKAAVYDRVVGARAYNRVVWGTSTAADREFASEALASGTGPMLDARARPEARFADGRITRIYAIRNPHKLARLDEEATLSR